MMRWQIIDGPYECEAGEDAHMAWEWTIEGGGQRRKVRVELSTDLIDAESAAIESQLAASLRGRSAFEPFLNDDEPPARFVIRESGVVAAS
jgi:hypothetical protein